MQQLYKLILLLVIVFMGCSDKLELNDSFVLNQKTACDLIPIKDVARIFDLESSELSNPNPTDLGNSGTHCNISWADDLGRTYVLDIFLFQSDNIDNDLLRSGNFIRSSANYKLLPIDDLGDEALFGIEGNYLDVIFVRHRNFSFSIEYQLPTLEQLERNAKMQEVAAHIVDHLYD